VLVRFVCGFAQFKLISRLLLHTFSHFQINIGKISYFFHLNIAVFLAFTRHKVDHSHRTNTTIPLGSTWRSKYHVICLSWKRNKEANTTFECFDISDQTVIYIFLRMGRSLYIVCKPLAESLCVLRLRTTSHHLFHGYDIIAPQLSTVEYTVTSCFV
jgi:hypothetical protein